MKPGCSWTDRELGYGIADRPVHVNDFNATLLHLLGLDHEKLTYRSLGLDQRLTGVEEHHVVQRSPDCPRANEGPLFYFFAGGLGRRVGPLSGGMDLCQATTALLKRATTSGFFLDRSLDSPLFSMS